MTGNIDNLVHASCVAIGGNGIMISGPSGSGKSDLALRLIDRGATLISDDYTELSRKDSDVILRAPDNIRGKIEVRSLGVLDFESINSIPLRLKVRLDKNKERFPMDSQTEVILGKAIAIVAIDAFEQSAAIKVELALKQALTRETMA